MYIVHIWILDDIYYKARTTVTRWQKDSSDDEQATSKSDGCKVAKKKMESDGASRGGKKIRWLIAKNSRGESRNSVLLFWFSCNAGRRKYTISIL